MSKTIQPPINHTINHGHTVGWKYTKYKVNPRCSCIVVSYILPTTYIAPMIYDPLSDIISKSKAACLLYVYIYIYR